MRQPRWRLWLLRMASTVSSSLVVAAAGCQRIPGEPVAPTAVISLTLVAGESLQVASVTEGLPAQSSIPSEDPGIAPERVALAVIGPCGAEHVLEPASPFGRYVIRLTPIAGERYYLTGTIDGRAVEAETAIPTSFEVSLPAGDTITVSDGTATLVTLVVPYRFASVGAAAYGFLVIRPDGTLEAGGTLRAETGELVFLRSPEVRDVLILAYDLGAAEWLGRSVPRGNIQGAFGGFGGALVVRRTLATPP